MKKLTILFAFIVLAFSTASAQNIQDSVTKYRDISEYYYEIKDHAKSDICETKINHWLSVYKAKQDSIKANQRRLRVDSLKTTLQKRYKIKL